jgi:acetoacetate decarboxylase
LGDPNGMNLANTMSGDRLPPLAYGTAIARFPEKVSHPKLRDTKVTLYPGQASICLSKISFTLHISKNSYVC